MIITPVELWPEVSIPTSVAIVYTAAPAGNGATIKRAVFTNTSATPQKITVYKVPRGGSPNANNMLINAYSVDGGEDYVPQSMINMTVPPGGSIQLLADAGGVINTTASGFTF
jgi:hypothetical protein